MKLFCQTTQLHTTSAIIVVRKQTRQVVLYKNYISLSLQIIDKRKSCTVDWGIHYWASKASPIHMVLIELIKSVLHLRYIPRLSRKLLVDSLQLFFLANNSNFGTCEFCPYLACFSLFNSVEYISRGKSVTGKNPSQFSLCSWWLLILE